MTFGIAVRSGVGGGATSLVAFDQALLEAGVANLNLVRLSSVIPPGVDVSVGSDQTPVGQWGDILFAVWAFQSAEVLGQEAWAGVAWAQSAGGRGVFVEHEGASEAQVRSELNASLDALCESRGFPEAARNSVVRGVQCSGEPVGALVIAPYRTRSW